MAEPRRATRRRRPGAEPRTPEHSTPHDTKDIHVRHQDHTHAAGTRLLPGRTVRAGDLPRLLAGWGNANWRATALLLEGCTKTRERTRETWAA